MTNLFAVTIFFFFLQSERCCRVPTLRRTRQSLSLMRCSALNVKSKVANISFAIFFLFFYHYLFFNRNKVRHVVQMDLEKSFDKMDFWTCKKLKSSSSSSFFLTNIGNSLCLVENENGAFVFCWEKGQIESVATCTPEKRKFIN